MTTELDRATAWKNARNAAAYTASFMAQAGVPTVAQGSSGTTIIGVAEFSGEIASATFVANTAITGADTDTRKIEIVNKGADGQGTKVLAAIQFDSGTNAAGLKAKAIPVIPGAAVAAGDLLVFVSTKIGTGIADPGGYVSIAGRR